MHNLFNLTKILTLLSLLVFSQLASAFTYQGEISQLGSTYDGPANIDFTLYDAATLGTAIGGVDSQTVSVSNGRFVVDLDQWIGEFDGRDFWLEIAVDLNTGSFTTLDPRQKLAAAPYAEYAYDGVGTNYTAGTGLTLNGTTFNVNVGSGNGLDADLLDGKQATEFADSAQIAAMQAQIDQLVSLVAVQSNQITNLENKTQYISVTGTEIYITGANLSIRSGSGSTDGTINGLGNLIVGYNESSNDIRTGSHNLVVGTLHSYSSYGGIVVGRNNTISGRYSSVTSGQVNTASGDYSSVTGGQLNEASSNSASVTGGSNNTASALGSSVTGGNYNNATGQYSGVSGGQSNRAMGSFSNIAAGRENVADGESSSVSGGANNSTTGNFSSVSGGANNVASGLTSSVNGGVDNDAYGLLSSVSGGSRNKASGSYSVVVGGGNSTVSLGNEAFADYSVIVGGFDNITGNGVDSTIGRYLSILGGEKNNTLGLTSSIVNGYQNSTGQRLSVVLGGNGNFANGEDSTIVGGFLNTTSAFASSVSGGQSNTASGNQSTVGGGNNRTASGTDDWVAGGNFQNN